MVLLLDLDENRPSNHHDQHPHFTCIPPSSSSSSSDNNSSSSSAVTTTLFPSGGRHGEERLNPNLNQYSALLGCWPVIASIAENLDLNDLHALSRTCRQVRFNVLQYRRRLVQVTLRCHNDGRRVEGTWTRWMTGRSGACARDLVSDCRRCGRVVCRNCIAKPPTSSRLPERLRRLCSTCRKAPIAEALKREQCACESFHYLCIPCGGATSGSDAAYFNLWKWRAGYSRHFGLGTGIGEGNEGVKCSRGEHCLGAQDVILEFDCGNPALFEEKDKPLGTGNDDELVAGYLHQEVEGIGGVVKKKTVRRIRVGKTVREYEDERQKEHWLSREAAGELRGWCGWCNRVIPGQRDAISM